MGDKEMLERGTWIDLSEQAKKKKKKEAFVCHYNAHQMVTSEEEF